MLYELYCDIVPQAFRLSLQYLKTAMARHRLNVEYEYEFFLAGISCHERPYRLCWAINNALEIEMSAIALHAIALKKNNAVAEFSVFNFENRENETSFSLIANKSPGDELKILILEQSQLDYFFIVKGAYPEADLQAMLQKIKLIPFVIMATPINPKTLKSKQNLLF